MLETANRLLGEDYRPFPNFEQFDVDALPTTSDVVTMLSQYLRTMDRFRCDHTQKDFRGDYSWNLPNGSPSIKAKRPKSFHA